MVAASSPRPPHTHSKRANLSSLRPSWNKETWWGRAPFRIQRGFSLEEKKNRRGRDLQPPLPPLLPPRRELPSSFLFLFRPGEGCPPVPGDRWPPRPCPPGSGGLPALEGGAGRPWGPWWLAPLQGPRVATTPPREAPKNPARRPPGPHPGHCHAPRPPHPPRQGPGNQDRPGRTPPAPPPGAHEPAQKVRRRRTPQPSAASNRTPPPPPPRPDPPTHPPTPPTPTGPTPTPSSTDPVCVGSTPLGAMEDRTPNDGPRAEQPPAAPPLQPAPRRRPGPAHARHVTQDFSLDGSCLEDEDASYQAAGALGHRRYVVGGTLPDLVKTRDAPCGQPMAGQQPPPPPPRPAHAPPHNPPPQAHIRHQGVPSLLPAPASR